MAQDLEGEDNSLWMASTPRTDFPALDSDDTVYDVAVVGGGITGIVAAYYLQRQGKSVVLVEQNKIVEWTTGGTTAKLSSQHYLIYDYLVSHQGEDIARAFGKANQDGIDAIEALSTDLGIDCEFARRPAFVFSQQDEKLDDMKREVEAAKLVGLPATFETEIDLPFEITGAVKFADQAQFHPRKFLLGIIDRIVADGAVVYENTKAEDIRLGDTPTLVTDHGEISAKKIIQASGKPFWHGEVFDDFMWEKMSYALGVTLKSGEYPKSMYITTDTPMRTIRTAEYEGKPMMIFGGESHEFDEASFDPDAAWSNLITDVHKRYDVEKVAFRWLASDFMPYDRMPFIGTMPDADDVYAITGYRAWGLAWAMSAADAVVSAITGQPKEWVKPFSTARLAHPLPESERVHGF